MRKLLKKIVAFTYAPYVLNRIKQDTTYSYKGLNIIVKSGVFHPAYFFSTKFLLKNITKLTLKNKSFLELGAGSGIISFQASKMGAIVTALDINKTAIEGLHYNTKNLGLNFQIIESNLFDALTKQKFDFIIINPPYYPKEANNEAEQAWYCGENFEYFVKLFNQLNEYTNSKTTVWMCLSEECEIEKIKKIGEGKKYRFELIKKELILWEYNYLYQIFFDGE